MDDNLRFYDTRKCSKYVGLNYSQLLTFYSIYLRKNAASRLMFQENIFLGFKDI